jgi:hypothetical protein
MIVFSVVLIARVTDVLFAMTAAFATYSKHPSATCCVAHTPDCEFVELFDLDVAQVKEKGGFPIGIMKNSA